MLAHIPAHYSTMPMALVVLCAWKAKCVTMSAQHKQASNICNTAVPLHCKAEHDYLPAIFVECSQCMLYERGQVFFLLLFVAGSVYGTAASLSWLVVMQYSNNVSVSYMHH